MRQISLPLFLLFLIFISSIAYAQPSFQNIVSDLSDAFKGLFDSLYDVFSYSASFFGYEDLYQNEVFSILFPTILVILIFFVVRGIYFKSVHIGPIHFEALRFHEKLKIVPAVFSILVFLYFVHDMVFALVLIIFLNFTFILFDVILESFSGIFNDDRVPVGLAFFFTALVNGIIYQTGQYKKIVELVVGAGIILPLIVLGFFVLYFIIKKIRARKKLSTKEAIMEEHKKVENELGNVRMEEGNILERISRLKKRMLKEQDTKHAEKYSSKLKKLDEELFKKKVEDAALEEKSKKILEEKPPSETYEQRKKRYEEGYKE